MKVTNAVPWSNTVSGHNFCGALEVRTVLYSHLGQSPTTSPFPPPTKMLRISRSLLSVNRLAGNSSRSNGNGVFCLSTSVSNESSSRFDADYTIFKGKAALSVRPKLPEFSKLDCGISKLDKKGVIFLTFWPASGVRKYDWEKKQVFALSPTEVGSLICLGPSESCDFLHDPAMKSSQEGQVKKSLSVTPLSKDEGYFITLSVVNNIQKTNERLSVPVTKGEFTTIRTALSYALPHIMGWGKAIGPQMSSAPYPSKKIDPSMEWAR